MEDRQPLLAEEQQAPAENPQTQKDRKDAEKSCWHRLPVVSIFTKLYETYDSTFLTMLGMQYFNQGTKVLVYLASSDLFKSQYHLDPGRVQAIQALTFLPWSLKICYGLISDNFPLFGSRRKSYLILGAII